MKCILKQDYKLKNALLIECEVYAGTFLVFLLFSIPVFKWVLSLVVAFCAATLITMTTAVIMNFVSFYVHQKHIIDMADKNAEMLEKKNFRTEDENELMHLMIECRDKLRWDNNVFTISDKYLNDLTYYNELINKSNKKKYSQDDNFLGEYDSMTSKIISETEYVVKSFNKMSRKKKQIQIICEELRTMRITDAEKISVFEYGRNDQTQQNENQLNLAWVTSLLDQYQRLTKGMSPVIAQELSPFKNNLVFLQHQLQGTHKILMKDDRSVALVKKFFAMMDKLEKADEKTKEALSKEVAGAVNNMNDMFDKNN